MIANYHSHTARCHHAYGTMEEYVQLAIARELKIFGFSDHTPQWFPGDYYSKMRMYPEELQGYCEEVRALQKKYAGQLEIPLGLEVEYYPALFKDLIPRLQDAGIEYILLGQHWCGNEEGEIHCGRPSENPGALQRYCDQTIAAMETGLFTYLAHPDHFNFIGDPKTYTKLMRRLCRAANDTGTPLEINLLGQRYGRHYPNEAFWALAAEEGCRVILGMDAHAPDEIADRSPERKALEMVAHYGLNLLETVPLKRI